MDKLQDMLGYEFNNIALVQAALTHSSFANEHKNSKIECNERLEFLGDSILGMTVAEHLYLSFPQLPEGRMTRIRSELVCEQSLFIAATELDLGKHLRLGKGEENNKGRERPSILADALEAVIAAIYLDGGMEPVKRIIHKYIINSPGIKQEAACSDFKTVLQELVQQKSGQTLKYQLISESGPDHMKTFVLGVVLNGKQISTGTGRSKKEAEQEAARLALEELQK